MICRRYAEIVGPENVELALTSIKVILRQGAAPSAATQIHSFVARVALTAIPMSASTIHGDTGPLN